MFDRNISQTPSEQTPFQTTDFAHNRTNESARHEPLPGAREVRIVLGGAFFSWLALALLTFRASDPSLFHAMSPAEPIANWCGAFGAHCAAMLYVLFGPAAWGTLLFGIFILPRPQATRWELATRAIAALTAMVSAGALFAIANVALIGPMTGGIFGGLALSLVASIGTAGCVMGYGMLLLFSLLAYARISLETATHVAVTATRVVARMVWRGMVVTARWLWASSSWLWSRSEVQEQQKQTASSDIFSSSGTPSGEGSDDTSFEVPTTDWSEQEVPSFEIPHENASIGQPAEVGEQPALSETDGDGWHSFMPTENESMTEQESQSAPVHDEPAAPASAPIAEPIMVNEVAEARSVDELQPAHSDDTQWQSEDGGEKYFDFDDDSDDDNDEGAEVSDDIKKVEIPDDGFDFIEPETPSVDESQSPQEGAHHKAPVEEVVEEVEEEPVPEYTVPPEYTAPHDSLFTPSGFSHADDEVFMANCQERGRVLEEKLSHFGVSGRVVGIHPGPVITLFEYEPDVGSKVSKIVSLEDDLAMSLKALSIRIIAPVPGKCVVGFEIANEERRSVLFSDIIAEDALRASGHKLPMALGSDIVGNPVIADLATMPHLLVAGATGAGKSVGMNVMLTSLLASMSPDQVRMILIDPKRLEFAPYSDVPHLLFPIVTSPYEVAPVLKWVVQEMELRYEVMAQAGVRNIADYHKLDPKEVFALEHNVGIRVHGMPYMVIMIDELADLMMVASKEIETLIARIAQMARAAGIHMIVATQRPSVDVVTGLIKANFPSRIAFRVSTKIDSRTIIDGPGAEKLLGKGDMLYLSPSNNGLQRLHGAYVTDQEVNRLTDYLKEQREVQYFSLRQVIAQHSEEKDEDNDPLYDEICEYLRDIEEISISSLQRKYRVGFNRSARLIEMLERDGYIAPAQGSKPRRVLRTE